MPIFDYFIAQSDQHAAAVIAAGPAQAGMLTVEDAGVDPAVQLATLDTLATGLPLDEVMNDPGWARTVAEADGGNRLVLTVRDDMARWLEAQTTVDAGTLTAWAESEEFGGVASEEDLGEILLGLGDLARQAASEGARLYCWVSV